MNEQQRKSIDIICNKLKENLENVDKGLDSLREFIMVLEPEDQSNELLTAYQDILNFLEGISESKALPTISYNQTNNKIEYAR